MKTIPIFTQQSSAATGTDIALCVELQRLRLEWQPAETQPAMTASGWEQTALQILDAFAWLSQQLDETHGKETPIKLTDEQAEELIDSLRAATLLAGAPAGKKDAVAKRLDAIVLGIALWAMRHGVPLPSVQWAPIVNALASRANAAETRQDAAAAFTLMQGVVAYLAPAIADNAMLPDEENPWRILNLNLAIAAIRTGELDAIHHAFDQLERALPDECAGFYRQAVEIAHRSSLPEAVRASIEAAMQRTTSGVR